LLLLFSHRAFAASFDEWKSRFSADAVAKHKISRAAAKAVSDAAAFVPKAIELDRRQPEFVKTFWKYHDAALTQARVDEGRRMLRRHAKMLGRVSRKYKVQPHVLLAFWGMETNYGRNFGGFSIASALATLAFDGRRAKFFAGETLDFMRIVAKGNLSASAKGSWAGAFGNFQFMPSTFIKYAADGNGDGKIDIFGNLDDAFSSAANYLSSIGWNGRERWGRAVRFPTECARCWDLANLYEYMPVDEWAKIGVAAYDGSALPASKIEAALIMPQGDTGPAFLVYPNFKRIMKWNASVSYALSVGLLADAIIGAGGALDKKPDIDARPLSIDQLRILQRRVGSTDDGVLGRATLRAVKKHQAELLARGFSHYKSGRRIVIDGYPDMDLFEMED
jgi:membrane-bound lytic murein transglycosylase B